jgi:hypothetical protein
MKSLFRSLFAGVFVAILLDTLVPRRLTSLEFTLCLVAVIGLFELVKAEIRAAIQEDAEHQHVATRVWLRDWFDYDHSHCVTSKPFDPNHPHPWVAFEQRYGTKKGKVSEEGKDE